MLASIPAVRTIFPPRSTIARSSEIVLIIMWSAKFVLHAGIGFHSGCTHDLPSPFNHRSELKICAYFEVEHKIFRKH
jgi:hypothetical protein